MAQTKKSKAMDAGEWEKAYQKKHALCQEFTNKLENLIRELLQKNEIEVAQLESRTKSVESFVEKIQRKGEAYYTNPLEQITDLVGVRIITYYDEDVDKLGEIIKKEFQVDWRNSTDKTKIIDPDRFGYLSVQYVVSLSPTRKELPEWEACSGIKAEIQVKTVLQHAWAAIDHKLRYKTAIEVPKNLRRQLFRLSALLELADEQFSNLRTRTEEVEKRYSQKLKKGRLDFELDLSSLDAYLNSKKQHIKWKKIAEKVGFNKFDSSELSEKMYTELEENKQSDLINTLQLLDIKTVGELNELLTGRTKWGEETLAEICNISSDLGFVPYAHPYDVVIFLLLYKKRERDVKGILEKIGYVPELTEAIMEVVSE